MATRTAPTLRDVEEARERLDGIARVTPVYGSETLSRLAGREIWLKADSPLRGEITNYVQLLDRHLRANADRIGESREPGIRVLTDTSLGIEFQVSVPDRLVTVVRAWGIPSRS